MYFKILFMIFFSNITIFYGLTYVKIMINLYSVYKSSLPVAKYIVYRENRVILK